MSFIYAERLLRCTENISKIRDQKISISDKPLNNLCFKLIAENLSLKKRSFFEIKLRTLKFILTRGKRIVYKFSVSLRKSPRKALKIILIE